MYYLQSRYYDPAIGRFINADSIISTDDSVLGSNMFAYCGNNPVMGYDPTGEFNWGKLFNGASLLAIGITACAAALTVVTAGACAPLLVAATVTFVAGGVTVLNGAAEVIESGTGYNFVRDGLLGGNEELYEKQKNFFAKTAEIGTTLITMGSASGKLCFTAGTMVLVEDGRKAIENVVVGDYVWVWDEETGEKTLRRVTETYVNQTSELVHVFVGDEEIITTPTHPFYSPVKGWTDAAQLRAGDILVLVNGEYVVVEKVQHEILESPINVYNFQVAGDHTYYVSDIGVLVHNGCGSNHGNSLSTNKPAQGYILRDKDTYEILKYGETTRGYKRYTKAYLEKHNAFMDFVASGTKAEMHQWQHNKILNYVFVTGQRPPLNLSFY